MRQLGGMVVILVLGAVGEIGCSGDLRGVGRVEQAGGTYQGHSYQGGTYQGSSYPGSPIVGVTIDQSLGVAVTGGQLNYAPNGVFPASLRLRNGARIGTSMQIVNSTIHWLDLRDDGLPWNMFVDPSRPLAGNLGAYANNSNANGNVGAAANRDVVFYNVYYFANSAWQPLCPGANEAVALRGTWGNTNPTVSPARFDAGYWTDTTPEFTFACTNGVLAKCVRWGYKPWTTAWGGSAGSIDLAAMHRACARAAVADFCADGNSYTIDGTVIDLFDEYGLIRAENENAPQYDDPSLSWADDPTRNFHMEASFDEGGGGCIAHARRVQLPADCRVDYEQVCEYDPQRRHVVCTWQASTVSAIDVTDGNFAGCRADRAGEGREQLIGVKDHGTL